MRTLAQLLALVCVAGSLVGQTPETQLIILPGKVQLDSGRDFQRILVMTRDTSGTTVDCTEHAELSLSADGVASISRHDGKSILRATHDGEALLLATFAGHTARATVKVTGATSRPNISFRNEVMPALTRTGCNAGSCHGAAAGKNGFPLSLFGYDPTTDHRMLTRELRSRRINFAEPAQSLMLQKATAKATHQGGKRIDADDEIFKTLHDWIVTGAIDDEQTAPEVEEILVMPRDMVLVGKAATMQLLVLARYADGTDRDVTDLALWSSSNSATAEINEAGRIRSGRRGEAVLMARFGGKAAIAQVLVHEDDSPFTWPEDLRADNVVDEHVYAKLRRARTLPADLCSDSTFLRRVYLDLLGVLPTPEDARAFLDDNAPDKRDKVVDALLERPEFAAVQAMNWSEVLQVDATTMGRKGATLLGQWLREAFEQERSFDEVVRELLTSEGATFRNPPANFHMISRQPHLLGERAAQVLLGVRLQCAQCHDHPFERWTMDDYYGFAAFFGQIGRKRALDPDEWIVWGRRSGSVRNPRDNSVSEPLLLGGGPAKVASGQDRRSVLADWLVAPDNPFFARNVANRVFARMFGRGLVEPVDDVRIGNPATHPELLGALAQLLIDSDFDVRPVAATICKSDSYQRQRAAGEDPALYAGYEPRRLPAESLLDAIAAVTMVPTKYPGLPLGSPASAIDSGRSNIDFLAAFGRPNRSSACTCDRSNAPTLGQTLHLINGNTVTQKVANGQGRMRKALAAKTKPSTMLDDLFLAAYSRIPRAEERERMLSVVMASEQPQAAWEDIYWSVLNSKEFLFQH